MRHDASKILKATSATIRGRFLYGRSLTTYDDAHIRLIHLLPRSEEDDDVHLKLEHYAYDGGCPAYETLSYVWGVSSDKVDIVCNDQKLGITCSLSRILVSLRADVPRTLWIDQICINQEDNEEKTQQVGMMRNIYMGSTQTVAWVDESTSRFGISDDLGNVAELLAHAARVRRKRFAKETCEALDDETIQAIEGLAGSIQNLTEQPETSFATVIPSRLQWARVSKFLSSRWLQRMWIIQEAAVSPRLMFQMGRTTLSLDVALLGLMEIYTAVSSKWNSGATSTGWMMFVTLAHIRYLFNDAEAPTLRLRDLLVMSHRFAATDVRDRYYALYGLCQDDQETSSLEADYKLSAKESLIYATFTVLGTAPTLDILELAECGGVGIGPMPSWIPSAPREIDARAWSNVYNPGIFMRVMYGALQNTRGEWPDDEIELVELAIDSVIEEMNGQADGDEKDPSTREPSHQQDFILKDDTFRRSQINAGHIYHLELDIDGGLRLHAQFLDRVRELAPVILLPSYQGAGFGSNTRASGYDVITRAHDREFLSRAADMDFMVMHSGNEGQYPTGELLIDAYRRTVCADQQEVPDVDLSAGFDQWRNSMKFVVSSIRTRKMLRLKPELSIVGCMVMFAIMRVMATRDRTMTTSAMANLWGRRLAWTEKGYLAIVPAKTEIGDSIFSITGASMPYVLNSTNDTWRLLGPAYSHGMMKGELLEANAGGIIKLI